MSGNFDIPSADYWGPNVRRVLRGTTLECQELVNGKWTTFWSTDEISNDYAYTQTRQRCQQRATKHIGGH